MSETSKAYVDQSYPLWLIEALGEKDDTTEETRAWSSQSRPSQSRDWEILNVKFREPVSISQVAFELLTYGCEVSLFYRNRAGKRVPVLDRSLRSISRSFSESPNTWQSYSQYVYPLVATELEIRIRRTNSSLPPTANTTIQMRNLLLKRSVQTRDDTLLGFERDTDPLGNYVTKTVKDWSPEKAVDGEDFTFWLSEPQPSPEAVVSYYLDVRDGEGREQHIDRFWLDPLYSDQHMNVYYSSDDTVGARRLSGTKVANWGSAIDAVWKDGSGMELTNTSSSYDIDVSSFGISHKQGSWFGLNWAPYFDSASPGFTQTLTLMDYQANSTKVEYNPSTRKIQASVTRADGSVVSTTSPALNFVANQSISLVAQVGLTSLSLRVKVAGSTPQKSSVALSGAVNKQSGKALHFGNVEGLISAFIFKFVESSDEELNRFLADPYLYVSPDPVLEDEQGRLPSTTLDNAIVGGDWRRTESLYGGLDSTFFTSKIWSPIWRDWVTRPGYFYLPTPVQAKYLKFEFTNLSERPYPVYDTGLETKYQSFPVSVKKMSQAIADTITTRRETTVSTKVKTTVDVSRDGVAQSSRTTTSNSLTRSISSSSTTSFTERDPLFEISVGNGEISTVPKLFDQPLSKSVQVEIGNRLLTKSTALNTSTSSQTYTKVTNSQRTITEYVAHDAFYTVVRGDWLIKIGSRYDVEWRAIYEANKKLIDSHPGVARLPKRSEGWWIFPGQRLRIPGAIMEEVTRVVGSIERRKTNAVTTVTRRDDLSVTGRTVTTTTRERFTGTSVHRYEIKKARRDVALAYFAGLREIKVFRANWSADKDDPEYVVYGFAPADFTYHGVKPDEYNTLRRDPSVTAPLDGHAPGHVTSKVYPSFSKFQRVEIDANARPFTEVRVDRRAGVDLILESESNNAGDGLTQTSLVNSTEVSAGLYSVTANPLYYAEIVEVSPGLWTIREPSSGMASVEKDLLYQGSISQKISRYSGTIPVSLSSMSFDVDNLSVGYASVTYYAEKLDPTSRLKLIVARDGVELFSEEITNPTLGRWATYTTRLEKPAGNLKNLSVTLTIAGSGQAEVYVGRLSYSYSTIYYYVSNDSGSTWHDATTIVNRPRSGLVFPTPNRFLKFRVQMLSDRDYVYGIKLRPHYLPEV